MRRNSGGAPAPCGSPVVGVPPPSPSADINASSACQSPARMEGSSFPSISSAKRPRRGTNEPDDPAASFELWGEACDERSSNSACFPGARPNGVAFIAKRSSGSPVRCRSSLIGSLSSGVRPSRNAKGGGAGYCCITHADAPAGEGLAKGVTAKVVAKGSFSSRYDTPASAWCRFAARARGMREECCASADRWGR
jgi:hypothetical protein